MVPCLVLQGSVWSDARGRLRRGALRAIPRQCRERADHGDDDKNQGEAGDKTHGAGRAAENDRARC